MFDGILSEEMLEEAKKNVPVFKQTLKDFGSKIYGTLTWGAGIGAFIGPIQDILGDRAVQIGKENVYLLATAIAASLVSEVGKDIYKLTKDKIEAEAEIEKKGLEGEYNLVRDKLKNDESIDEKYAAARSYLDMAGKVINDTTDILTFTAFFTPVVQYISSLAGVADLPDPVAAAGLIGGAVGVDLVKNLIEKFYNMVRKEDEEEKKKKGANEMKVDELRKMIKETLQQKSFLLASPLNEMHEKEPHEEEEAVYDPNEGRLAKSQLYKMMNYAHYLHDLINDDMDLPEWVEAKITKASDYLGAVKHHLEYEFYRTGTPFEVDQNDKIPREATLDMVKGLADRTSCPKTRQMLLKVIDELDGEQPEPEQPMEEEEY